jgi:hypothetical protein
VAQGRSHVRRPPRQLIGVDLSRRGHVVTSCTAAWQRWQPIFSAAGALSRIGAEVSPFRDTALDNTTTP